VVVTLALVAIVVATAGRALPRHLDVRRLSPALTGLFGSSAVVLAVVLVRGTSLSGVVDGIVLRPLRLSTAFCISAQVPTGALATALLSVVLAVVWTGFGRRPDGPPRLLQVVVVVAKAVLGIAVLAVVHRDSLHLLSYWMPFMWVLLVPAGDNHRHCASDAVPRAVLAVVAVVMTLWAYPIFGTQAACATLFVLLGLAVCGGDALNELSRGLGRRMSTGFRRLGEALVVTLIFVTHFVAGPLSFVAAKTEYMALSPCRLEGAERIRMTADDVELYRWLVSNLERSADSFVSLPGFNSLYLWLQQDPPTGFNTTTWMTLLSEQEQLKIRQRMMQVDRMCVVYNPAWTRFWTQGRSIADQPLVEHIMSDFEPRLWWGEYSLLFRSERGDSRSGEEIPEQGESALHGDSEIGH
jgi:hypothetical protein